MANANENPELEVGFCTEGTAIDIPESLRLLGVTPENPTIHGHVINKLFKMIFENLNHQKKKAISFWEPDEYYIATANNIDICRRNNKIYFCKQTHNDTGDAPKDPATNPDYWTVLYDLDKPIYDNFVSLSGIQTISGIKTFTSLPVGPSVAPTADYQMANKKFVEDYLKNQTNNIPFNESGWSYFQGFKNNGILATTNVDANTLKPNSTYFHNGTINVPEQYGVITTFAIGTSLGTDRLQIFYPANKSKIYIRRSVNNQGSSWTSWEDVSQGIGTSQSWKNVTASRANNVTYTNNTSKPIMVNVSGSSTNTTNLRLFVGSELVSYARQYGYSNDMWVILTAIVPVGATYRFHTEQGVINFWQELR